jgi:competence protein ComEA
VNDLLQPQRPPSWAERIAALGQRLPLPASPRAAVAGLAGLAVAAVLVAGLLRTSPPPPEFTLPRAAESPSAPTSPRPGGPVPLATVHAAGQVANPGVYSVPAGARVADVLTAAGGTLAEADVAQLNLAAKVADGERVWVPKLGEAPPAVAAAGPGPGGAGAKTLTGPVDLNTATAEQLDQLPGVGPATAQAILTWRTRNGRFRSVADLLEVPGIGPAKLEALRPLVKV